MLASGSMPPSVLIRMPTLLGLLTNHWEEEWVGLDGAQQILGMQPWWDAALVACKP